MHEDESLAEKMENGWGKRNKGAKGEGKERKGGERKERKKR